ncbi:MAG TPA: tetratricopeptide repeat protein [Bacillota bacterium]|nr:tetratricopeptide repeat protein [Bacillota bacterium]
MQPLEPPDSHFLLAAIGWVELGNAAEAEAELNLLPAERQTHPDVLEVRWLIYAEQKYWEKGLLVARQLLEQAPERSSGWLHQAYALRRVPGGGLTKAWEALLPAAEKFPQEPTIPYNLSCYACQLHQLDAARTWLQRAAAISGKEPIQKMALADPDLEPLWAEIRQL